MKTIALASLMLSTILCANNSINTPMIAPSIGNITVLQSHSDKELEWVDEQIKAILPSRVGVTDGFINSLIDPIKYGAPVQSLKNNPSGLLAPPKLGSSLLPVIPKVIEEPLKLQALINKSALINGKWYKINDSIRTYSLSEIKSSSVLLNGKKGQPLVLFLSKTNNNITINTK
jgi:hypothetical protein